MFMVQLADSCVPLQAIGKVAALSQDTPLMSSFEDISKFIEFF